MKYTINNLINQFESNIEINYLFFYGHHSNGKINKSCFSQWYESKFEVDGVQYRTAEQYMMAEKARLFNDDVILNKILMSDNPNDAKKLGRIVSNFDENIWDKNCIKIVTKGNYHKFNQNDEISQFLINTDDKVLVEASPYDKIWGIGMDVNNVNIKNPLKWNGTNLLGFVLMDVRDKLKQNNESK